MNKVYFFIGLSKESKSIYIAASNWKDAKNIATSVLTDGDINNPIIKIKGELCYKYLPRYKRPIVTELLGVLTTQQVCDLGLSWWNCDECSGRVFEIFDHESKCRCLSCGFIDEIPPEQVATSSSRVIVIELNK